MRALIDADSIIYIIAWNYQELGTEDEVRASCDNFIKDMLTTLGTTQYIGAFSEPSETVFRTATYRYAKYKGTRPEKADYIKKWEPVIKNYLIAKYGFTSLLGLEADDVISGVAALYLKDGTPFVVCSPDKDLRQVEGLHFDYRSPGEGQSVREVMQVDALQAHWNFWTQMLTGDGGDNIAGVPGLGPVKAGKILDTLKAQGETITTRSTVLAQYCKYFGDFYGQVIFNETEATLRLMSPTHIFWSRYGKAIEWISVQVRELVTRSSMFDISS